MNNMLNKDKFINFYNKRIKLFNTIFSIIFILKCSYRGRFAWLFSISVIFLLLLNFIYFNIQKRLLESILFGSLLVGLLIFYIVFYSKFFCPNF